MKTETCRPIPDDAAKDAIAALQDMTFDNEPCEINLKYLNNNLLKMKQNTSFTADDLIN